MKQLLIIGLFLFSNNLSAQNLFQNADFEDYYGCPTGIGQFDSLKNWISVMPNPDYFNCNASVYPFFIDSNAFSEFGFVGIGADPNPLGPVEAFGQNLQYPLVANKEYKFSFYSKIPLSGIGSDTCSSVSIYGFKNYMPKDTLSFHHISELSTAKFLGSSHKIQNSSWMHYEIIFNTSDTLLYFAITVTKDNLCKVYFLIDSVSLTINNTDHILELGENNLSISPNPNAGIFNINLPNIKYQHLQFAIVNAIGQLVKTVNDNNSKLNHELDCKELPNGLYNLIVKADGMPLHTTKFIIHR